MVDHQDSITEEAARLLHILNTTPFQDCHSLSREFNSLPNRPVYAICHRTEGTLYIGKSGNVRSRLRGGHKHWDGLSLTA